MKNSSTTIPETLISFTMDTPDDEHGSSQWKHDYVATPTQVVLGKDEVKREGHSHVMKVIAGK